MRQEMELAMKMLEKDVCEKQDALVALRQQLDDLRALKHELSFKLQVRKGQDYGPFVKMMPLSQFCFLFLIREMKRETTCLFLSLLSPFHNFSLYPCFFSHLILLIFRLHQS